VDQELRSVGVGLTLLDDAYLVPPDALETKTGGSYRVFSAFYRQWRERISPTEPAAVPESLATPPEWPASSTVGEPSGAPPQVQPAGERAAAERLREFVDSALEAYDSDRDLPAVDGTTRLSPHIAWGEISVVRVVREIWDRPGAEPLLRQLAWREFAAHVLHHSPEMTDTSLRPEFEAMPWESDPEALERWKQGQTGFPFVDAGMRQLNATGWMHNRARLIVGSFLCKDLLFDWREGEAVFWDRLVDADVAQNAFNWQWIAGSGTDAAPYFRIFNPMLQGRKLDPDGEYVRRWVPELGRLDARWIHSPWEAPADELESAGIELGREYSRPMVDHFEARDRALAALDAAKATAGENT
jgi:deoxyribodipyrimidine photo-lyase